MADRAFVCALGALLLALGLAAAAPSDDPATAALRAGDAARAEQLAGATIADQNATPAARAQAFFVRGLARDALGNREDALVDFTEALWLKVLPADQAARVLYDRGVALDELGRPHDALGDYDAALKLLPGFAAAYNNRANIERREGRYALARLDYRRALKAGDPAKEFPYFGLGQIAEAQKRYALARRYYGRALAANPHFALASQSLAALDMRSPVAVAVVTPRPRPREHLAAASYEVPAPAPQPAHPDLRATIVDTDHAAPAAAPSASPVLAAAAAPAASPPAPVPTSPDHQIQLGAWRDEADAAQGWNRIAGAVGDLLHNLTPHIVAADLPGKGRYFRLRAGPVDRTAAREICGALRSRGFSCLPVNG